MPHHVSSILKQSYDASSFDLVDFFQLRHSPMFFAKSEIPNVLLELFEWFLLEKICHVMVIIWSKFRQIGGGFVNFLYRTERGRWLKFVFLVVFLEFRISEIYSGKFWISEKNRPRIPYFWQLSNCSNQRTRFPSFSYCAIREELRISEFCRFIHIFASAIPWGVSWSLWGLSHHQLMWLIDTFSL